ncbi:MAG: Asp-tRNA(Asn)/Glu-tRNA(Gln) amidotransferase subunit GatC [Saprospiraceae bacterium]|nr:Asp-tRNA(Asn)/Glu-tRNA(Gln) amidotransferase subunit GatC [Saprospiraceae bacterium]
MQLDKDLISRLEKLARLQLSDPERDQLTGDLQSILNMVDKLRELDTTGVEPLVYLNNQGNVWREDAVGAQLTPAQALQNAPKQDGQYFRVPKVIEER